MSELEAQFIQTAQKIDFPQPLFALPLPSNTLPTKGEVVFDKMFHGA
jgi:hypothetical protein